MAPTVADLVKFYADAPPPKKDSLADLEAHLDALRTSGYRSPFKFEPSSLSSLAAASFGTTKYGPLGEHTSAADALTLPGVSEVSSLCQAHHATGPVLPEPTPLSELLAERYGQSPGLIGAAKFLYDAGENLNRTMEAWRPQLKKVGAFVGELTAGLERTLNALRSTRPLDPYGNPVPLHNTWLYVLARRAYQGDFVARAAFLDEIDADDSLDNVLLVEDLLEPTFGGRRTDLRKRWEQETPEEARTQLRELLKGHMKRAPLEAKELRKGEYVYEHSRQILTPSELAAIENKEDERILYEQLRGALPEQQFMFCWYRSQGLDYEEIAAEMGIGVSSVKTYARRAKANPNLLGLLGR